MRDHSMSAPREHRAPGGGSRPAAGRREHPSVGLGGDYVRLSALPVDYDPFSPDTQRRLCQEAADRRGVKLVREFVDLDYSARRDIYRPGYEDGIKALIAQEIEYLFVPTVDRFSRCGMGQVGLVLDELEKVGGRIIFVKEDLDSSDPTSRLIVGVLAERARAEADQISWRIEQFHETARRMGLWVRVRPYGYVVEDQRLKPHPEEALVVRRIVDEFLGGAALRAIARRLNEEGIPCPKAVINAEAKAKGHRTKPVTTTRWSYIAVRSSLTAPVTAALHSHNRQLVYDDKGDPISCGEGIITLSERASVMAELERRRATARKAQEVERCGTQTPEGRPAKYLLIGFARCGHCHGAMNRTTVTADGKMYGVYRCSRKGRGQRCRGGAVMAEALEGEVVWRYTARLAACEPDDPLVNVIAERWLSHALPESEADRKRLSGALEVVTRRIADLYDDRYERHLFETAEDLAEWEDRVTSARFQRDTLQARLVALGPRKKLDIGGLLETELSTEEWKRTPLERQRDLLRLGVKVVLVYNAKRGQRPMSDRIRVVFADEDIPEPVPEDDSPQDARLMIADLVAEERAGRRPPLTGREAATIIGFIMERQAQKLLAEERAKQAEGSVISDS
jgi:site-specific DNA recombinase